MRRYGLPSGRGSWTRVVATLAVAAMVVSLAYSVLVGLQAPIGVVFVIVVLLIGVPIWLLARHDDRR